MSNEHGAFAALFEKYLHNACTEEELDQLLAMLPKHDDPLIDSLLLRHLDVSEETPVAIPRHLLQTGFTALMVKADTHEAAQRTQPTRRLWPAAYRVAATLLLVLGVGIALWYTTGLPHAIESFSYKTIETQTPQHVTLADGTGVQINAHSRLRYPHTFDGKDTRRVALAGEAYFEVAKDPQKPFIIETGHSVVQVVGTAFNVKELNDSTVLVAVTEGKVRLSFAGALQESVTLSPGMLGILSGTNLQALPVQHISNYLSWFKDNLIFTKSTLASIVLQLEHIHNVNITVTDEALNELHLNLQIRNYPIEQVLDEIALALDLTVRKTSDGFELSDGRL